MGTMVIPWGRTDYAKTGRQQRRRRERFNADDAQTEHQGDKLQALLPH